MLEHYFRGTAVGVAGFALMVGVGAKADVPHGEVDVPSTIRLIVAYSAGGSSDALARTVIPYWERYVEELSGQSTSMVVVNLPGAGGEVGFTSLSHADPNGTTIGVINLPALPLTERAREVAFAPWVTAFEPIGVNVIDPNVVMLRQDTGYETLGEAVEAAVEDPGSVVVGADGPLSDDHLAVYALERETGATFSFIPYAGGAPANRAFLAGEVDINVGNVFDYMESREAVQEAAVFLPEPYPMIPEVDTVENVLGVDAGELGSTRGLAAPAETPEDILALYRDSFAMAVNDPDYKADAEARNITIVEPRIGEAFGAIKEGQDRLVDDLLEYFIDAGYVDP